MHDFQINSVTTMAALLPDMLSASRKRTRAIFGDDYISNVGVVEETSHKLRIASKLLAEYESVKELPPFLANKQGKARPSVPKSLPNPGAPIQNKLIEDVQRPQRYGSVRS